MLAKNVISRLIREKEAELDLAKKSVSVYETDSVYSVSVNPEHKNELMARHNHVSNVGFELTQLKTVRTELKKSGCWNK